jgi:hypothetical protein
MSPLLDGKSNRWEESATAENNQDTDRSVTLAGVTEARSCDLFCLLHFSSIKAEIGTKSDVSWLCYQEYQVSRTRSALKGVSFVFPAARMKLWTEIKLDFSPLIL